MPARSQAIDVEVRDPDLHKSGTGWRDLKKGRPATSSISDDEAMAAMLNEEHHRFYGRPWYLGRVYFDYLREIGLSPKDRVLDFGCGAGRVGIWTIPYLDVGNYVGIDHHWDALDAFARYEIPLHGLESRRPSLILDGSLQLENLGTFDFILDFSVSQHIEETSRLFLYEQMARALRPGGKIVLTHGPSLGDEQLYSLGLRRTAWETTTTSAIAAISPKKANTNWCVIQSLDASKPSSSSTRWKRLFTKMRSGADIRS